VVLTPWKLLLRENCTKIGSPAVQARGLIDCWGSITLPCAAVLSCLWCLSLTCAEVSAAPTFHNHIGQILYYPKYTSITAGAFRHIWQHVCTIWEHLAYLQGEFGSVSNIVEWIVRSTRSSEKFDWSFQIIVHFAQGSQSLVTVTCDPMLGKCQHIGHCSGTWISIDFLTTQC